MTFDGPTIHGSVNIVKGFGLWPAMEWSEVRSKERRKEASAFSCFMCRDMS